MEYFFFLNRAGTLFTRRFLGAALLISITEAVLVSSVVSAAQLSAGKGLPVEAFIRFGVSLVVWYWGRRYILDHGAKIIEDAVSQVRLSVTEALSRAELRDLEELGEQTLLQALAQDCQTLYDTCREIITPVASIGFMIGCILYIALLSSLAAVWIFVVSLIFMLIQRASQRRSATEYENASAEDRRFLKLFDDELRGFAELRINRTKLHDFLDHDVTPTVRRAARIKLQIAQTLNVNVITFIFGFYAMLGAVVFILPNISEQNDFPTAQVVMLFIFLTTPMSEIAYAFPSFSRASAAVGRLTDLEAKLLNFGDGQQKEQPKVTHFERLRCEDLVFTYPTVPGERREAFQVGPINLELRPAQIVFLIGGNGSGKSTLIRLLCGLYPPSAGHMVLDDHVPSREELRACFSIILQDFHLFERLLGHPKLNRERIDALLNKLRLRGLTDVDEQGRFTSINLSKGQMKRLALLVAELDDRQILLFDEWAADQDPDYRRYFYEEYLPALRAQGKTILAATHDDHYFHIADRILRLDNGQLSELEPSSLSEPLGRRPAHARIDPS